MNEKDGLSVIIIHGAVRRASTYRWMNLLKIHLLEAGIPDVRLFYWSGKANDTAIEQAGADIAENILTWFCREKDEYSKSLRVFGKSSGGLVFRSALRHLADRSIVLPFDLFLQVAAPNPPFIESTFSIVKKIVNIYSRDDWFLRFFLQIGPYKGYHQIIETKGSGKYPQVENMEIPKIGHDAFNWNTPIRNGIWSGRNLYDVYANILCE